MTHTPNKHLTNTLEENGCKLFADNLLSPALFDDLVTGKVNCFGAVCPNHNGMSHDFGAVCPNHKGMPHDFGGKRLKLKQDDTQASWGDLTTL